MKLLLSLLLFNITVVALILISFLLDILKEKKKKREKRVNFYFSKLNFDLKLVPHDERDKDNYPHIACINQ